MVRNVRADQKCEVQSCPLGAVAQILSLCEFAFAPVRVRPSRKEASSWKTETTTSINNEVIMKVIDLTSRMLPGEELLLMLSSEWYCSITDKTDKKKKKEKV